ncbi:MAG: hypothetical protein JSS66_07020 [Armatimonadetes bacterium]|nr:hypothetical protein [Armatimonadota bacterium]
MRILFLDDQESRYKVFKQLCIGKSVQHIDWAEDTAQAIAMLADNPRYDLVCIDHDLGEEHYKAYHQEQYNGEINYGDTPTGYDFALHIAMELEPEKQPRFAAVHSFNENGSKRIVAALSEAGGQEVVFIAQFGQMNYLRVLDEVRKRMASDKNDNDM